MKSKKKLLATLAALVVVIAAGYGLVLHKGRITVAAPGALLTLPATTVNLPNGHLLQVTVAVQFEKGVSTTSLPANSMARMENAEILALSQFHYSQLLSASGKRAAEASLLGDLRAVVGPGPVGPAVLGIYLTNFVMQ